MFEWYSWKLVEYGNGHTGYWYDYQPTGTITHCKTFREVRVTNQYGPDDDIIIIRGPALGNFSLQGPCPDLPKSYRKYPEKWAA